MLLYPAEDEAMTVGVEMMWGGGDGMAQGDGQAMGKDSGTASSNAGSAQGGTSPSRRPAVLRGNSLDSLDGGSLERSSIAVRQCEHVLATAERLGRNRRLADHVAGVPGAAQ